MLSILIPVFNYDCSLLVRAVHSQVSALGIPFEILCFDDCSTSKSVNIKGLSELIHVKHQYMATNQGRSRIRNLLAATARYDNLLFLDCDSMPADNDFIKRYIDCIGSADCICGGTIYNDKSTIQRTQTLHWTYGTRREMKAARSQNSFMANNFFIKRNVFMDIGFDTDIQGYGHEDTIFGITLLSKGYGLLLIENPVFHLGLNNTDIFLDNTRSAVINLRKLYDNQSYKRVISSIRLVKIYNRLSILRIASVLRCLRPVLLPLLTHQLRSRHPYMLFLDLYKLLWFC